MSPVVAPVLRSHPPGPGVPLVAHLAGPGPWPHYGDHRSGMAAPNMILTIEVRPGTAKVRVCLHGSADASVSPVLSAFLDGSMDLPAALFEIDLRGLRFLDCAVSRRCSTPVIRRAAADGRCSSTTPQGPSGQS